ncbi:hypothetical protein [Mycobacterium sp. AT1]|uniref:hypothetical protein n=1 Tax=Mycobacterium sp. AT1 TaxID=1961706 RepID=UPI0009AC8295|nr:hypothetical protein [Mycobacterium sp. AT1]OPX07375.1 hypothetical protein B1790_23690 [Mycobacterium sp. AT1]
MADRLLAARRGDAALWRSYATSPLAAVLLTTAHANAGFADLAAVRDLLVGTSSESDHDLESRWGSVADRCPHRLLGDGLLLNVAGLSPVQRDSLLVTALDALTLA